MITQDCYTNEVIRYMMSVSIPSYTWKEVYERIIRCCVTGVPFIGKRHESDIAFIAALMNLPKADEFFLHPRGIVVENVHFYSNALRVKTKETKVFRFDLANSRFLLPLALRECTFAETLDLRQAHLASLDLTGSTLPALMLQGARLDGPLILDKIHVTFGKAVAKYGDLLEDSRKSFREADGKHDADAPHAGIDANDVVTGARVSLKGSLVRGGIRLRHARIGGDFVAKQAAIISRRYAKDVCLQSPQKCECCLSRLCGDTRDRRTQNGNIPIELSSIERDWAGLREKLNCKVYSTEPNWSYNPDERAFDALFLFEASVKGTVELTDGFISIGEVSLNSTRIEGGLYCRGGRFFQHDGVALSMDGIRVGGSIYLDEYTDRSIPDEWRIPVPFEARGTVSLRGASIEHRLFITKAHFLESIKQDDEDNDPLRERESYGFYAKRLRVAGDMFFNKTPKYSERVADHSKPAVGQEEAHLIVGPICMENARIGGRLLLAAHPAGSSSKKSPFLTLDFARVEATANLEILAHSRKPKSCELAQLAVGEVWEPRCVRMRA